MFQYEEIRHNSPDKPIWKRGIKGEIIQNSCFFRFVNFIIIIHYIRSLIFSWIFQCFIKNGQWGKCILKYVLDICPLLKLSAFFSLFESK